MFIGYVQIYVLILWVFLIQYDGVLGAKGGKGLEWLLAAGMLAKVIKGKGKGGHKKIIPIPIPMPPPKTHYVPIPVKHHTNYIISHHPVPVPVHYPVPVTKTKIVKVPVPIYKTKVVKVPVTKTKVVKVPMPIHKTKIVKVPVYIHGKSDFEGMGGFGGFGMESSIVQEIANDLMMGKASTPTKVFEKSDFKMSNDLSGAIARAIALSNMNQKENLMKLQNRNGNKFGKTVVHIVDLNKSKFGRNIGFKPKFGMESRETSMASHLFSSSESIKGNRFIGRRFGIPKEIRSAMDQSIDSNDLEKEMSKESFFKHNFDHEVESTEDYSGSTEDLATLEGKRQLVDQRPIAGRTRFKKLIPRSDVW